MCTITEHANFEMRHYNSIIEIKCLITRKVVKQRGKLQCNAVAALCKLNTLKMNKKLKNLVRVVKLWIPNNTFKSWLVYITLA